MTPKRPRRRWSRHGGSPGGRSRGGIAVVVVLVFLALLASIAGYIFWILARERTTTAAADTEKSADPIEPLRAGWPAARVDGEWLAAARGAMADESREDCGPFALWTDVAVSAKWSATCGRIASRLDSVYLERYGVEPTGEPAGAVLLFADAAVFRRFATELGHVQAGYGGFSRASRGIVALYGEGRATSDVVATLAHELTHLANRRAFGPDLAPWLSEGLAEAIGETAHENGFARPRGIDALESQAERLAAAYRDGRAGSLERLASLTRPEFDRGVAAFDYEQSVLLVRFLRTQADLESAFKAFLRGLAVAEPYEANGLPWRLGTDWSALETRFVAWLSIPPPTG